MEDRCAGWQTGICEEVEEEMERIKTSCPDCGLPLEAENTADIDDMMVKHNCPSKSKGVRGDQHGEG